MSLTCFGVVLHLCWRGFIKGISFPVCAVAWPVLPVGSCGLWLSSGAFSQYIPSLWDFFFAPKRRRREGIREPGTRMREPRWRGWARDWFLLGFEAPPCITLAEHCTWNCIEGCFVGDCFGHLSARLPVFFHFVFRYGVARSPSSGLFPSFRNSTFLRVLFVWFVSFHSTHLGFRHSRRGFVMPWNQGRRMDEMRYILKRESCFDCCLQGPGGSSYDQYAAQPGMQRPPQQPSMGMNNPLNDVLYGASSGFLGAYLGNSKEYVQSNVSSTFIDPLRRASSCTSQYVLLIDISSHQNRTSRSKEERCKDQIKPWLSYVYSDSDNPDCFWEVVLEHLVLNASFPNPRSNPFGSFFGWRF